MGTRLAKGATNDTRCMRTTVCLACAAFVREQLQAERDLSASSSTTATTHCLLCPKRDGMS